MRAEVIVFLVAVAGNAPAASSARTGEPVKIAKGYPVVAMINGHGPFSMLLDTGATRCALSVRLAEQLGLVSNRRLLLVTITNEKMVRVAHVAIRVGSSEEVTAETVIDDMPGLARVGPRIEGLLGATFLGQHPYVIDYRSNRLWFGGEALAWGKGETADMPVEFSYGRPLVLARTGSNTPPFRLILDSGVDRLVLRCSNNCPDLMDRHSVHAVTNTGESDVTQGRLPALIVGTQKHSGVTAVLVQRSDDPNDGEGSIPLSWFPAIYVDTGRQLVRFRR